MPSAARARSVTASVVLAAVAVGCGHHAPGPSLAKTDDEDIGIPVVPVPKEGGPRLGAIAAETPIFDRPSHRGTRIGTLRAGETVTRAAEPFSTRGCAGGWYPIRPEGFVCASGTATTDLTHPTLVAMGLAPARDATLPYTYARAATDTTIYSPDPTHSDGVIPVDTLRAKSGFAVVGSWTAADPSGKKLSLAMTTDGRFVAASDLEAAKPSDFHGVTLDDDHRLPLAFVVKRGVHRWSFHDGEPEKGGLLDYHARIDLTGHSRKVSGVEFWAAANEQWVRLRDVTLIRPRSEFPAFVKDDQKWIDVSVVTGELVAYEGRKPIFATLASVGRDGLGAPGGTAATIRGELQITGKQLTAIGRDPGSFVEGITIQDAPWALELSSGQLIVGAYWHDRFGIEHGPGNLELAPADAAKLFRWAAPELPADWHGITKKIPDPTLVDIR